jgi:hypothetical protein
VPTSIEDEVLARLGLLKASRFSEPAGDVSGNGVHRYEYIRSNREKLGTDEGNA